MKIARFDAGHGAEIGIVNDRGLVPVTRALPQLPVDMAAVIASWSSGLAVQFEAQSAAGEAVDPSSVTLLAPIARPGKILAIGLNYADHIAESGMERPTDQVWFCKHDNSVNGPHAPIQIPRVSSMIDYEAEMVAVIGKGGKHIPASEAAAAVFGYCVGNDVSVRDWQWKTPQWMLGKSFDTHGPFGPWITTADEVGDPHRLGIRAIVNGDVRQNSNTSNLVFNVWEQIAHLSQAMTLAAGDIIYTGTPGGVGAATKNWLKPGDICRIEIDELGAIEARCEAEG